MKLQRHKFERSVNEAARAKTAIITTTETGKITDREIAMDPTIPYSAEEWQHAQKTYIGKILSATFGCVVGFGTGFGVLRIMGAKEFGAPIWARGLFLLGFTGLGTIICLRQFMVYFFLFFFLLIKLVLCGFFCFCLFSLLLFFEKNIIYCEFA